MIEKALNFLLTFMFQNLDCWEFQKQKPLINAAIYP